MEQEIQHLISIGKTPKEAVRSMQASYKQLEPYNEKLEQAKRDYQKSLQDHIFRLAEEDAKQKNRMKLQDPKVIGEDSLGNKVYGFRDENGNIKPIDLSTYFTDKASK